MLSLPPSVRIYVCVAAADMRKGFDGLAAIAREVIEEDLLSGHLFVFRNRSADRIKVLYWDRDGYAIWQKRLERGSFAFPASKAKRMELTSVQLQLRRGVVRSKLPWYFRCKIRCIGSGCGAKK